MARLTRTMYLGPQNPVLLKSKKFEIQHPLVWQSSVQSHIMAAQFTVRWFRMSNIGKVGDKRRVQSRKRIHRGKINDSHACKMLKSIPGGRSTTKGSTVLVPF